MTEVWRQRAEEMADVRQALAEWQADNVEGAMDILVRHGRVVVHSQRSEFLAAVVEEWYDDRLRRRQDPDLEASSAMAEYHRDRRELNAVPMEYLTRRLDRGIHGALAHSYALTTHAAQGARHLRRRPPRGGPRRRTPKASTSP